jgi:hypothetical protein
MRKNIQNKDALRITEENYEDWTLEQLIKEARRRGII